MTCEHALGETVNCIESGQTVLFNTVPDFVWGAFVVWLCLDIILRLFNK